MTDKIVITGFGCLSALGHSAEETWNNIKDGKTGIERISSWDTQEWEYALGAEIKNLDLRALLSDRKILKMLSRHDVIGLAAVQQAIAHSQLLNYRETLSDTTAFNERTGVYVSSPGSKFSQQYDFFPLLTQVSDNMQRFGSELNSVVNPMWLLKTLPNNVLAYTGIQYGFKGANQNIVNHSVGGSQAILEATAAIRQGVIDRAVVIGYDIVVEPQTQAYYAALGVLSKTGVKPFDDARDGTVLANGAGAMMIETLSSAKERGAKIYGEIIGGISTSEAMGVFPIREDGLGLSRAMEETLQKFQLNANDIGMITTHGNGTSISDSVEASVINTLFHNQKIPVTGFKWAIGHTFSAAGIIESIMTLFSLQEKIVPGIATLKKVAKDCSELRVSNQHQPLEKPIALLLNRSFASITCCLALSAYEQ